MADWTTIAPHIDREGSPVLGDPEDFFAVAGEFEALHDDSDAVGDLLIQLRRDESAGFRGQTADAFANTAEENYTSVRRLARIALDAETIFQGHALDLEALRSRSAEALARAETRWNDRRNADQEVQDDKARLASIDHQINALGGDSDFSGQIFWSPEQRSQVQELALQREYALNDLKHSEGVQQLADRELRGSSNEWDQLNKDERELNTATVGKLEAIELGVLADPTGAMALIEKLKKAGAAAWEWTKDIGEYLLSEEFLGDLKEALSVFVEALEIVAVVCTVLSLIPIPGLQALAAVATTLAVIALALTALSQLVSTVQYARGYIDAEELGRDSFGNLIAVLPGPGKLATKAAAKVGARASKQLMKAAPIRTAVQGVRSGVADISQRLPRVVTRPVEFVAPALREAADEFVNPMNKVEDGIDDWAEDAFFEYRSQPASSEGANDGKAMPKCGAHQQLWVIDADLLPTAA